MSTNRRDQVKQLCDELDVVIEETQGVYNRHAEHIRVLAKTMKFVLQWLFWL